MDTLSKTQQGTTISVKRRPMNKKEERDRESSVYPLCHARCLEYLWQVESDNRAAYIHHQIRFNESEKEGEQTGEDRGYYRRSNYRSQQCSEFCQLLSSSRHRMKNKL